MMNLQHCTFTGVDEATSIEDLASLSSLYPFIEWGFLFSTSESSAFGRNRYPSIQWFKDNLPTISHIAKLTGVSLALHVCGKETKNLLGQKTSAVMDFLPFFNRVQINFRYKDHKLEDLENLLNAYPEINFITQHNRNNIDLYEKLTNPNHQVLFDSSGGRGIATTEWLPPLPHKTCGYAGGLGPETIHEQLQNIHKVVKDDKFWIDMEGHLRTDDKLDLNKCNAVAHQVKYKIWVESQVAVNDTSYRI